MSTQESVASRERSEWQKLSREKQQHRVAMKKAWRRSQPVEKQEEGRRRDREAKAAKRRNLTPEQLCEVQRRERESKERRRRSMSDEHRARIRAFDRERQARRRARLRAEQKVKQQAMGGSDEKNKLLGDLKTEPVSWLAATEKFDDASARDDKTLDWAGPWLIGASGNVPNDGATETLDDLATGHQNSMPREDTRISSDASHDTHSQIAAHHTIPAIPQSGTNKLPESPHTGEEFAPGVGESGHELASCFPLCCPGDSLWGDPSLLESLFGEFPFAAEKGMKPWDTPSSI